jgi:hypothetical protein
MSSYFLISCMSFGLYIIINLTLLIGWCMDLAFVLEILVVHVKKCASTTFHCVPYKFVIENELVFHHVLFCI